MARLLPVVVALCVFGVVFAKMGEPMVTIARDGEASTAPANWVEIDSTVDYTATVNLTVVLQRRNMDAFKADVEARSDPRNPNYAKWFTREEIQVRIAPTAATIRSVMQWLESVGVSQPALGLNQDTIVCLEVPLQVAEKVLDLNFRTYQEVDTKKTLVRAVGAVRVPESVSKYVSAIVGASGFPILHSVVRDETPDYITVTPSVIVNRYNVSTDAPTAPTNLKAVAEFQGQYILQSDVCTFFGDYSVKGNCTLHQIIGQNLQQAGIESTLDVEYIASTSGNVPLDFYIFGGMDFCSDMVQWTTKLLSLSAPGYVHSVSYGAQYYSPICDASVRDKIDSDFLTLNGRGITIVIASGDSGSGQYSRAGYNNGFLVPSWPAESPYVTSVGATYFYNGNLEVESAVTQFGSGGGFSWNEKTQPTWQQSAVAAYFAGQTSSTLPPAKSYNPTGRATPDVSALGEMYTLILQGQEYPGIGGTSASTPVFAGIVTRLNDIRLLAGKGTLGNINSLLYQNPSAFYDVTIGNNAVSPNTIGWNCAKGWDPVTGLGTPNYKSLEAIVQALN